MLALALAAVVLALFASPAQAITRQIVLGPGQHPSVAVPPSTSRVVHAVWATTSGFDESEGVLNAIGYCRWRVGRPACETRQTLLVMGREGDFSAPEITAVLERRQNGPSTNYTPLLVITDSRCCGADQTGRWVLTSRDDGDTWRAARVSTLSSAHGSMLHRAGMFEVVHPGVVDPPAGPSLTFIGSGFATFGFPVALDHVHDLNSPLPLNTTFPGFADDGARRVDAEGMGILPDGRLFAVGYPRDDRGGAAFMRTTLPGANPRDVAGGWTPWQPFTLPLSRESAGTAIEDVAEGAADLLVRENLGLNDVLWALPLAGSTPGRRALIAAATGDPVTPRSPGRLAQALQDSSAVWVTQKEACPRGRRCLVFRRTENGAWTGPKEIVRSVPLGGPDFGDATLAARFGNDLAVAWSESRRGGSGLPEVRLAWPCAGPTDSVRGCERNQSKPAHHVPFAELGAPNIVSGRSFTATVTGNRIDRVRVTLLPPVCRPPSTGDPCFAFRRPVRRGDGSAPYTARFTRLPVNRSASTISFWKNRLCGVDAYLYRLRARVVFTTGTRATLWRNLSVCPPLT
jgi:hypothetical protein